MRGALAHAHGLTAVRCGSACVGPGSREFRARAGCDAPSTIEGQPGSWSVRCACVEDDGSWDERCATCAGTGTVWHRRCPAAVGCFEPGVTRLIRSMREFREHGAMPAPGGTGDQAAWWYASIPGLARWEDACARMAAEASRPPGVR